MYIYTVLYLSVHDLPICIYMVCSVHVVSLSNKGIGTVHATCFPAIIPGPLWASSLPHSRIHARTSCRSCPMLYPDAGMGWAPPPDAVLSSANPVAR
jgi:hypothetical protein